MSFRPLSFTKNLGGFENLHRAIRAGFEPGINVREFTKKLPGDLRTRAPVIYEFFLATKVVDGTEYVFEDTLIRHTFFKDYCTTHARLYFFALLANLPGERTNSKHLSPGEPQNNYVRTKAHDGSGWLSSSWDLGTIKPWVRTNVALSGGREKFATNFHHMFERCDFTILSSGHIRTFANYWAPLAIQLFFDRVSLSNDLSDTSLVALAKKAEIHKLLGVSQDWFAKVIPGAARAYKQKRPDVFIATKESAEERQRMGTKSPAGSKTSQINQFVELGESPRGSTLFDPHS